MQIGVLGPLEVASAAGAPCLVRGSRRRLLLATLVLHRNTLCATERLVDVLFGGEPPRGAIGTVQSYVSRLRHDLGDAGPRLQTRTGGYTLVVDAEHIDSERFERRVVDAQRMLGSDPARAQELLAEALSWWRGGRAFAEFPDDLALQAESTRLDEVRQRASEALVTARLAVGDPAGAIEHLETCIADWPLREGFRAQQMIALHRCGRQPEALRAFQRHREDLLELGLEPSPSLVDLEAQILLQDPSLDRPTVAAPPGPVAAAAGRSRGNLPLSPNALLGRDAELSAVVDLLDTARLVTVVGPGGVGKTRLALRVSERLGDRCPDGVWVCDLTALREDASVTDAVTTALDIQPRRGRSTMEGLLEVLRSRDLLIMFDNCEHVLGPISEIADAILRTCPAVRMVATSREPLDVDGERVWPLGPLALPDVDETDPVMAMESPAVRLFVARATAADPDFRLVDATVGPVSEICRRLDGLPLALELAAARTRAMAPDELVDRLADGFTVLAASGRRDPRHQTLRATVAWSYDLLGIAEQMLFDRLSVFAGRFTATEVERVCADGTVPVDAVANVLWALVDKSMVVADTGRAPTRYRLLETLRDFGREALRRSGAAGELQRRHAVHAVEQVEEAQVGIDGPDEAAWSARLDDGFDDLRIAHRWVLAHGDIDSALRVVAGVREFAFRDMRYEIFGWAEATLDLPDADTHPLAPVVLATAAYGRFVRGDLDRAMAIAQRSVEVEDRLGLPSCGLHHRTMGNVFYYRGDADSAADMCRRMVDAARASGERARVVHALYMASVGLTSAAQPDEGRRLAEDAVDIARGLANPTALASALHALALSFEPREPARAAALLEEAVSHGAAAGNRWIVAFARTELVSLAGQRGELDSALHMAKDVIDTWYRAGDWANQWLTMRHVAGALAQRGEHMDAAVLHAALRVASAESAMPIEASDLRRVGEILDGLPAALGPVRLAEATALGAGMSANEVVHWAQGAIDRARAAPAVPRQPGAAKNSRAMPSGSRKLRPDP